MPTHPTISRRGFFRVRASRPFDSIPARQPRSARAGLEPYTPSADKPWDRRRAAHLLRRTGFGAPRAAIDTLLAQNPVDAVNAMIDAAVFDPLPTPPPWHDVPPPGEGASQEEIQAYKDADSRQKNEFRAGWFAEMRTYGLREKMAFFWSNHLVTELRKYDMSVYLYQYLTLLRSQGFGNFKSLVYDMGLLPAMLIYLDGVKNKRSGPNENYARELWALFTLGIFEEFGNENYTQADIAEMARALPGLRVDDQTLSWYLATNVYDAGEKTFFGHTGNFGYDDVVDIIFQERPSAIAHHVAGKIYRFFVHAVPDPEIVNEMASIFLANDFEIAPVMRALLASEHFFESTFIGARFKSPVELLNGFVNETGMPITGAGTDQLFSNADRLGQKIFDPPNVAGWPEYHTWLSTGTLPLRWKYLSDMINGSDEYAPLDLIPLATQMSDPDDPYVLSRELADYFLPQPLDEEEYTILTQVLLDGMPDYEWSIQEQGTQSRLRGYLTYLTQLPQFQLT